MGITAKARSTTALRGSCSLSPEQVIEVIKSVSGSVKGGGASLLTTGITNLGATVNIVRESRTSLTMSLTSGKQFVELSTFSAEATASNGGTEVRVGGLETYKTQQEKLLMLIPVGPKNIYGMAPYKQFLNAVYEALRQEDPSASLEVSRPAGV